MSRTFVGIQVGAISFLDEGVGPALDRMVELADVNAVLVSALSWSRGNAGRTLDAFPDHGKHERDELKGGAFYPIDPKYYEATALRHFAAPDEEYAGFDALGDVIPEATRRGVSVYPYYCETAHKNPRPRWQPGFASTLEVDAHGRFASRQCLRNPDYRNWWSAVIDNWFNEYELAGLMWGIEREGPLDVMLSGEEPTCFCVHCRQEAARRDIDAERAAEGYRRIGDDFRSWRAGERPRDGHLITFLRRLSQYPEVMAWERLWLDGHKSLYRAISGQVRFHGDNYEVGLGVWQMINTFGPWLRAEHDPSEYTEYADWLKPVLYNVPAGTRFKNYINRLCETILKDAAPQDWTPVLQQILGLERIPFEELGTQGFSGEYVRRQTERFVQSVGDQVSIYPGLGIGVEATERAVTEPDVIEMVGAAFDGGAKGIMISRNYSELTLANLAAVGTALQTVGRTGR